MSSVAISVISESARNGSPVARREVLLSCCAGYVRHGTEPTSAGTTAGFAAAETLVTPIWIQNVPQHGSIFLGLLGLFRLH